MVVVVEVVEVEVMMAAAAAVERLEAAAAVGKAVMAELEALREKGRASLGMVAVWILDAEVKEEDVGVVLLGGAEVASHLKKTVEAVGDCQTVGVEVEGWMMGGVVGVVWKTVEEVGVLKVGEVGAPDLSSKTLVSWNWEVQAVRSSKNWMTSLNRSFH